MVTRKVFEKIKSNYGNCASWAVWAKQGEKPKSNVGDLTVLNPDSNPHLLTQLNPQIILVGLNISRNLGIEPLANFHDSKSKATDYKIRFALTDTVFWGAYMTDIIKDFDEVSSGKMIKYLRAEPDLERQNVKLFREEIAILGVEKPTLIAFGADVYSILARNFGDEFDIKKIQHYAARTSKEIYRQLALTLQSEINGDYTGTTKAVTCIR